MNMLVDIFLGKLFVLLFELHKLKPHIQRIYERYIDSQRADTGLEFMVSLWEP